MLFLFKIAFPSILVAVVSLASRRWGATVGGVLLGMPWMTGPVLFFLALDKGEAFAAAACIGIELGVVCISMYLLAYGLASLFLRWPASLAAAVLAFFATAETTRELAFSILTAAGAAVVSLAVVLLIMPRARAPASIQARLPWWDIPMRVGATLIVVTLIVLSAEVLGPERSGIVATFPAIFTVVGTFTHHQWGGAAVRRLLRGLARSLFSFIVFFLIVGTIMPAVGLVPSFVLAAVVSISMSTAQLLLDRRHRRD